MAADLTDADLERVQLSFAHLEGAQFLRANLKVAHLTEAHLARTQFDYAHLEFADLSMAHCEQAEFVGAKMQNARFIGADLTGTNFNKAHLEDTYLNFAILRNIQLSEAYLAGSYLKGVFMADEVHVGPQLVDVHWNDVNLAVAEWSQVDMIKEEYQARQKKQKGEVKDRFMQLEEHSTAIRANRQLAIALQSQGLNEDASRFAYRAQKLQRVVFRLQKKFGQYLFSGFLDLLAGYGYRTGRSVIWYLVTIFGFALAYFAIGHLPFFPDAFVFSLTSFHGRGFFPGLGSENSLHNPLVIMAAFEAVVGLLIEISFIDTFTQRFLGGDTLDQNTTTALTTLITVLGTKPQQRDSVCLAPSPVFHATSR